MVNGRYNKLLTGFVPIDSSLGGVSNPNNNVNPITGLIGNSPTALATQSGGLGFNLGNFGMGLASTGANIIGGIGGDLISDGMQSTAGNILNGISNVSSMIPGPYGIAASFLTKLVGAGVNRLWGSKMNNTFINEVQSNINTLNNTRTSALNFDLLTNDWNNAAVGTTFSNSQIGKQGKFNHDVDKKANSLRESLAIGELNVRNVMSNAANNIENTRLQNLLGNYAAFGGELGTNGADFTNGIIQINNGGTHEQNPNEGVIFGMDQEGVPNLVEEGEVIFNNYVYSNRIKVPKSVRKKHRLTDNVTFADAAKKLAKESEERPNDVISKNGLEYLMGDLMSELEMIKAKREKNRFSKGGRVNRFDLGTPSLPRTSGIKVPSINDYISGLYTLFKPLTMDMGIKDLLGNPMLFDTGFKQMKSPFEKYSEANPIIFNPEPLSTETGNNNIITGSSKGSSLANLRYIPALGSAISAATDLLGLTNKPDYDASNMVLEESKNAGSYAPVNFNPIGNYLTYNPFDRDYYTNKLNALSGASRRAILNTSGGNRATAMAGILAADNNYLNQLGSLARQAEEYNLAQRQQVENFNRATNQYNSEAALKADIANAENRLKTANMRMEGIAVGAKLRQAAKDASDAAKSTNLTNLFSSLGDIGREEFARNMITSNPANYYTIDSKGNITYKGLDGASSYDRSVVEAHALAEKKKRGFSRGGYLTIKRRR